MKILSKIGLKKLLLLLYIGSFLTIVITSYSIINTSNQTTKLYQGISKNTTEKLTIIANIRHTSHLIEEATLRLLYANSDEKRKEEQKQIQSGLQKTSRYILAYRQLINSLKERELFDSFVSQRSINIKNRMDLVRLSTIDAQAAIDIFESQNRNRKQEFQHSINSIFDFNLTDVDAKNMKVKVFVASKRFQIILFFSLSGLLLTLLGSVILMANRSLRKQNQLMTEKDRELQEQKHLFEGLFSASPDGIIGINEKGEIVLFNPKAEMLFGYSQEEVSRKKIEILIPAKYHLTHQFHVDGYFENPTNRMMGGANRELFAVKKTGDEFPVDIGLSYFQTGNGIIAISSIRDISENKKVENNLRESEAFNKNILSSLTSHIAVMDASGVVLTVNKSWADFARKNGNTNLERLLAGSNFFEHCEKAAESGDRIASDALAGIRSVLNKQKTAFELKYPCHSSDNLRWFIFRVMNFGNDSDKIVVSHTDFTELMLSKDKLQESEKNLKEIMDNSAEMIWSMDRNHRLIVFNKAFGDEYSLYSGNTPTTGIIFYQAMPLEDEHFWKQKIDETLLRRNVSFEFSYAIGNDIKYVQVFLYPIIRNKTVEGVTGFVMNISKRKSAEQALQKSEAFLSNIIKNLPGYVYQVNNDENYTPKYISESVLEITGYSQNEYLVERTISCGQELHPKDSEQVWKQVQEALNRQKPYEVEYRILTKKGEIKWVWERGFGVFDTDGTLLHLEGFVTDVTDLKKAEQQLEASEIKFRSLFERNLAGIYQTTFEGKILTCNDAFAKMLGYDSSKDFIKKEAKDLYFADTDRQFFLNSLRKTGELKYIEGVLKHKNGQAVYVIENSSLQNDIETGSQIIEGVVIDVSEHKKAQQELESNYKELKKINEELDQFVYSTSHDLRAPLMSILGLIDLSGDAADLNSEIASYLTMMKRSVHQVDDTIQSILDYSRNSRMKLIPETLNIKEMANTIVDNLKHLKKAQNIRFSVTTNEKVVFISDKQRVQTLINNLISNAIKYSREEEKNSFVKFSFISSVDKGVLAVEDNGEGIPNDKKGKIFEMFYRNSDKSVGSGLGLYICKEIVEKMLGNISVESTPGIGSRFIIALPNQTNG